MAHELSEFAKIEAELEAHKVKGEVPEWYIPQGYAMFTRKYAYEGETVKGAFERVASTLAKYYTVNPELAREKFFDLMWKGHLAPSTPVLSNTGTNRGHSVSCSGSVIGDSVDDFYKNYREIALLSQHGYGTSSDLSMIRPRGAPISTGGKADGVVPVLDSCLATAKKISQGNNRRGQWAGYLDVDHPDFEEAIGYIAKNAGEANIGWNYYQREINRLLDGDEEAIKRFEEVMYIRARNGKGYIWKPDAANNNTTEAIKRCGIPIRGSNLCTEIALPANEEYTFSCVLSSLNLSKWDEFDKDAIFWSTIFLDCVASQTIEQTEDLPGFEKIHKFTKDFRALGLGALGWHTYLQKKDIAFESFEAMTLNNRIFRTIQEETLRASEHLAIELGSPHWCEDLNLRNATLTAIAPNTSSALLCGGVSQGIEVLVANTFNQPTAAGEFIRTNPKLIEILKRHNIYSQELIDDIDTNYQGSVQHLEQLTSKEKLILKTAFEIDQMVILKQASQRQPYLDQGQSLNVFCDTDEVNIANVTKEALLDPNILGLYYMRSRRNIRASTGECLVCEA